MPIENDLAATADATVRVPANIYALLRQSYDTREKILDWMLAIGTVATMAYVFRDQIRTTLWPYDNADPDTGRADPPTPNQDVAGAFPTGRRCDLYTYNLPYSRTARQGIGPTATRPPLNPALPPAFAS